MKKRFITDVDAVVEAVNRNSEYDDVNRFNPETGSYTYADAIEIFTAEMLPHLAKVCQKRNDPLFTVAVWGFAQLSGLAAEFDEAMGAGWKDLSPALIAVSTDPNVLEWLVTALKDARRRPCTTTQYQAATDLISQIDEELKTHG